MGAGKVTAEEVEEVLAAHAGSDRDADSDATGNPIVFGMASSSKRIAVVSSDESDADLVIIRPVTADPVRDSRG